MRDLNDTPKRFTLTINTTGPAFDNRTSSEIATILRFIAARLDDTPTWNLSDTYIRDSEGKRAGQVKVR